MKTFDHWSVLNPYFIPTSGSYVTITEVNSIEWSSQRDILRNTTSVFISKPFRKYPVLRTFNDTKLTRKISTRLEETDKTRFRSARLVHVS